MGSVLSGSRCGGDVGGVLYRGVTPARAHTLAVPLGLLPRSPPSPPDLSATLARGHAVWVFKTFYPSPAQVYHVHHNFRPESAAPARPPSAGKRLTSIAIVRRGSDAPAAAAAHMLTLAAAAHAEEAAAAAVSSLGDAKSSLGDAESSLGDAESSLGDAESSLCDAESSLGDATSSLGDAERGFGTHHTGGVAARAAAAHGPSRLADERVRGAGRRGPR